MLTGFLSSTTAVVLPGWRRGKESTCQLAGDKRHGFDPWVGKIRWTKKWQPTQYSCLENSMDRGA